MLHTTPPTESDKIDGVRLGGNLAIGAGFVLCVVALVAEGGEPPLQVLGVFALVVLVGVGLRIEAALRQRT